MTFPDASLTLVGAPNVPGAVAHLNQTLTLPDGTAFTSWVQLTPSSSADVLIPAAGVTATSGTQAMTIDTVPVWLEIGVGASGSEDTVARLFVPVISSLNTGSANTVLPHGLIPVLPMLQITSGTRLSVRGQRSGSDGATRAMSVWVATCPMANLEGN